MKSYSPVDIITYRQVPWEDDFITGGGFINPVDIITYRQVPWEEMKGEAGFQERLNWKDVEKENPPQKGFGEIGKKAKKRGNISSDEGKLSKKKEKNPMIQITDDEIKEVEEKFKTLKEKYPDLVEDVSFENLITVSNYLNDPDPNQNEYKAWKQLSRGNFYGYSIFLHEKTEMEVFDELIDRGEIRDYKEALKRQRLKGHGKGLREQYVLLQKYLLEKTGNNYDFVEVCLADYWKDGEYQDDEWDIRNARNLINYLKKSNDMLYNSNKHREINLSRNLRLREIVRKIRNEV